MNECDANDSYLAPLNFNEKSENKILIFLYAQKSELNEVEPFLGIVTLIYVYMKIHPFYSALSEVFVKNDIKKDSLSFSFILKQNIT